MFYTLGELKARHLTGRIGWRAGWFGRTIMQVEVKCPCANYPRPPRSGPYDPWANGHFMMWRDASPADLANIGVAARLPDDGKEHNGFPNQRGQQ